MSLLAELVHWWSLAAGLSLLLLVLVLLAQSTWDRLRDRGLGGVERGLQVPVRPADGGGATSAVALGHRAGRRQQ